MSLKDALRRNRIPYVQGTPAAEVRINCLFCEERGESPDFRFRLGINIAKDVANCFNCHWRSGNAIEEISKRLALGSVPGADDDVEEKKPARVPLPDDFEPIDLLEGGWHCKFREYLEERGVSHEQIVQKRIGFSLIGRYGYRVIFPVMIGRRMDGFVARSVFGKGPKYLNTPGLKSLYNYRASIAEDVVVLSEGVFKCLAIENAVVDRVITYESMALLGHTMTDRQEDLLFKKKFSELVMWPDPDVQGVKGFIKIADRLSSRVRVSVPCPFPNKQADELMPHTIRDMLRGRTPYNENVALALQQTALRRKRNE